VIACAGASIVLGLVLAAATAAPASALQSGCAQAGLTVTCTYTSGVNEFDVPKGVSSIHVVAVGGAGGASENASGGFGAKVTSDFTVSAGEQLYAVVGANGFIGGGGFNGGGGADSGFDTQAAGGGGSTDLRTTANDPTSRILVAGGGGGAGDTTFVSSGGGGGNAGSDGEHGGNIAGDFAADGGDGGTAGSSSSPGSGGAGGAGNLGSSQGTNVPDGCGGDPGGLGTQSNGGTGGTFSGIGSVCDSGGGGGGGGYYGGGGGGGGGNDGGGSPAGGGGGGGGSSLVPSGGSLTTDSTGVPEVTISYTVPDAVAPTSIDFGSQAVGSSSAPQTVTLSNTGTASISVSSVSKTGANPGDFATSADTCTGKTIAAGGTCTIQASFVPSATGARTASLAFNDDSDDSPQTVPLSGIGTLLGDVKTAISGPTSAGSGSQDTYVMTVSNAGPSTALNVVMTAQVPNGTKFVGVSTTHGSCTHPAAGSTSGVITCTLGDLASGAAALDSVTLKITLTPKGGSVTVIAKAFSTATNTAAATPDPALSNNVASFSTTVSKK
jgi:uncharacterized repeat protein (TIGR01451 family)